MKRTQRFVIGLLAAVITFATLTATVGTDHWKRRYYRDGHHHYFHWDDHDYDHENWQKKEGNDTIKNEE